MSKSKPPPPIAEETLDQLLDKVSIAREELVAIERNLERLRSEITSMDKRKIGSRKTRRSSPAGNL
jgi:hypothetical protein